MPRTPGVFPPKVRHRYYDDSKLFLERASYSSATLETLEAHFKDEEVLGMMVILPLGVARAHDGNRLRTAAQGATPKSQGVDASWRITHDGSHETRANLDILYATRS